MKAVALSLVLFAAFASTAMARAQEAPQSAQPEKRFQIDIDYSQTPELKDWVDKELRPALEEWYPIIVADLPSEGFVAPRRFSVTIEANGQGVAATSDRRVTVSARWIKQQTARAGHNEAVGSVIHEEVHVVQQYGHARGRHNCPGWLTEGIADYIRWWKFEPASARRPIAPVKRDGQPASYRDSYQTTAAFLEYVAKNHDHEFVVKLNADSRNGEYSSDLWKRYTGIPLDALWEEFAATLKK